jgi:hypothetical protein
MKPEVRQILAAIKYLSKVKPEEFRHSVEGGVIRCYRLQRRFLKNPRLGSYVSWEIMCEFDLNSGAGFERY